MAKLPMPFSNPYDYPGHSGIDFPQPRGTAIPASGPGKIDGRSTNASGGNIVWVLYDGVRYGIGYAHMDNFNNTPPNGTRIAYGQTIGAVGNAGNSTGPHVHVENSANPTAAGFWEVFDRNNWVGKTTPVEPTQRVAGGSTVNGRSAPNTAVPVTQTLQPGTVADMNGWITGENVSGNTTWFRGAHSGDFFWSGGFTDTGTHDLADLNGPVIGPTQRMVGDSGVNGRYQPNANGAVSQVVRPGTIVTMKGWTHGESIAGVDIWFQGASSGDWFWGGGFTSQSTANLPEVDVDPDPPIPPDPEPEDYVVPRDLGDQIRELILKAFPEE